MTEEIRSNPKPIRDPKEVLALLRRVIKANLPVNLWHPRGQEGHLSALLGLKPVSGLYLDAPPASVIDLYQPGDALQVRSLLDGTEVRFSTQLQLHSRYQGYPALLCEWPSEVRHFERRRAFRVRVVSKEAAVTLELDEANERHLGRLVDLSVGGFGALIDREARLIPGEVLDCGLDLQDHRLTAPATVQSFDKVPGTHFWRLGASFDDLEPRQERHLSKLVLELQRQSIQLSGGGPGR